MSKILEDPKFVVQSGYDQLGSLYRTHYEQMDPDRYEAWLTTLAALLPPNADVLELGCGDGIPVARFINQRFGYFGVDISPVQLEQARTNVPQAQFKVADMAALDFPSFSFDGVVALYSIIHLPLAEQPALFKAVYTWLRAGGYFLCIVGAEEWTGTDANWNQQGITMYWSHADALTYQSWFMDMGFTILHNYFVAEGTGGHTYFLLTKHVDKLATSQK